MLIRRTGLWALLTILLVGPVLPAAAQSVAPEYVESDPSDGEMMHEAPAEVIVRFSEPLDESSTMEVRDECGGRVDDGAVTIELTEMRVGIAEEPSGTYTVNYYAKGIRGLTGQTVGSFEFMVHAGRSCDGEASGHDGHGGGGGGHDGHDGGGGGSGGHDGHDGTGAGGDHSGMDHSGMTDHSSMDHSATDPSSMDHSTMDHSSMDHSSMKHHRANQKRHGRHANHRSKDNRSLPPQAAPNDPLNARVDGSAVMLSLGLSLVLGVAGGWYLRTTAPR